MIEDGGLLVSMALQLLYKYIQIIKTLSCNHMCPKNSGHLWLAYTELQGGFNMLQLISVDSGHPYGSIK